MQELVRRELEVMFARSAQPTWFRIAKWVVYIGLAAWLRRCARRSFWIWLTAVPLVGVGLHLFYRWKTRGWTQSWGRWQYDVGGRTG